MCELLGINSRYPATVNFSLRAFERRWKMPRRKADGWGLSIFQGRDVLVVKEPKPAGESETLHFIENHSYRSTIVISHLRRAGPGLKRNYSNTQPFVRELYGRRFVFAHNGLVKRIFHIRRFKTEYYSPVGETDSEYAFCYLMDRLRAELDPELVRDHRLVANSLNREALKISQLGIFNFLMADGEHIFAFRSDRLVMARSACISQSSELKGGPLNIRMGPIRSPKKQWKLVIATVPLTRDRCWHPLPLKRVVVFSKGRVL